MKKSPLRRFFTVFKLSENMRIGQNQSKQSSSQIAKWRPTSSRTVRQYSHSISKMIPALLPGNNLGNIWRRYFPKLMKISMLQSNSGSLDSRKGNINTKEQVSWSDWSVGKHYCMEKQHCIQCWQYKWSKTFHQISRGIPEQALLLDTLFIRKSMVLML